MATSPDEAALDLLDAAGRAPVVLWDGRQHPLPDPRSMDWRQVVEVMESPERLAKASGLSGLRTRHLEPLHRAWLEAFDLGSPASARRLCYLMARHAGAIAADVAHFYPGVDAHALWRERRWRHLVGLLDHLPQHSYLQAALSQDIDHAMMVIQAQDRARKEGKADQDRGPSMAGWTPEVARLTDILDAVRQLQVVINRSNGGKASEPKPSPRPSTAYETARYRLRQKAHDILVRRMLPHLYPDDET